VGGGTTFTKFKWSAIGCSARSLSISAALTGSHSTIGNCSLIEKSDQVLELTSVANLNVKGVLSNAITVLQGQFTVQGFGWFEFIDIERHNLPIGLATIAVPLQRVEGTQESKDYKD